MSETQVVFENGMSASFLSEEKYWAIFDADGNFVECVESLQGFIRV